MPSPQPASLRALLFDGQSQCRQIAPDHLAQSPTDKQLLWVDTTQAGAQGLLGLGLDESLLELGNGGPLGLSFQGDWKYLHVRALNWREGHHPRTVSMVVAVGKNRLITAHDEPASFLDQLWANEGERLRVGHMDAMSFAAGLLDRMLTEYMDARDDFETALDKIEMQILHRARPVYLRQLQEMRQAASKLREALAGQRDLFDAIGRPDFDPLQADIVDEHCRLLSARYSKVVAAVEHARELINGSFDLYTSRSAESTNRAMHTLTVVTVAMGLAATIAGVLGMNFDAGLFRHGEAGFWVAGGVIMGIVVSAIIWAIARQFPGRAQ